MEHRQVLYLRRHIFYVVVVSVLIAHDDAEVVVWHGGIEVDGATVGIGGHVLSDGFAVLVGVLIADFCQIGGGDEPGQFQLAALAVGEGGCGHLWCNHLLGIRHGDWHISQSRHIHGIAAVAVAVDVPLERQLLPHQGVGHAPHGIYVEGLAVVVAIYQTLDVAIGLGQGEVVGGISLRHFDASAHVGPEMYVDVFVVVVGVAVAPPVEAGFGVGSAFVGPRHIQVAVVNPAVGSVHIVDGGRDADGVRPVEYYLILPCIVNMCCCCLLGQEQQKH